MNKGHDKGHKGQMSDREVMKLALENICGAILCEINPMSSRKEMLRLMDEAIAALHQALEQPEHGVPCGWVNEYGIFAKQLPNDFVYSWKPVYTTPRQALEQPEREWVGLTDEEIAEGVKQSWVDKQAFESAVWWAETKLRAKNDI